MEKLLSIIVPSYNMEKYLPNGLGSLVVGDAELLQSLDVIVVNDGSKDRTSEIAHGFEAKYPGVFRVIDKFNGNYGSCINAALPLAAGRFVKILDADDAYDTAAFERYLRALAAMPASTDVAFNDWVQVDESGLVTETTTYPFPTDEAFGIETILVCGKFVPMRAVAYRTDLLREIGYRQTEGISYTDTEWAYLPVASAREIRYVPENVYRYLFGREGQTMSRAHVSRDVWMLDTIVEGMLKRYENVNDSPSVVKAYHQRWICRTFGLSIQCHFMSAFSPRLDADLQWIRRKTDAYDFLMDAVRGCMILSSMPLQFRNVEFMMRHPRLARPTLMLVRFYSCLCAKL